MLKSSIWRQKLVLCFGDIRDNYCSNANGISPGAIVKTSIQQYCQQLFPKSLLRSLDSYQQRSKILVKNEENKAKNRKPIAMPKSIILESTDY